MKCTRILVQCQPSLFCFRKGRHKGVLRVCHVLHVFEGKRRIVSCHFRRFVAVISCTTSPAAPRPLEIGVRKNTPRVECGVPLDASSLIDANLSAWSLFKEMAVLKSWIASSRCPLSEALTLRNTLRNLWDGNTRGQLLQSKGTQDDAHLLDPASQ